MQSGDAVSDVKPASCPHCESKGPFVIDQTNTQYRNYQKITLQVRFSGGFGFIFAADDAACT
jgi:DNA replicative helicase MCM subunit Mcm2 (Cdc46/Mcm family)